MKQLTSAEVTEYLRDYLENNDLPEAMAGVMIGASTLADLFTKRFNFREIGFETEEIFSERLDVQTTIVLQKYTPLISEYNSMLTDLGKRIKTISSSNNSASNATNKTYLNDLSTAVTDGDVSEQSTNAATATAQIATTETETHFEVDEYNKLLKEVEAIGFKILNEFEPLFLQIF